MQQFRFRPQARRELIDAIRYYNSQQAGLGSRFLSHVENRIEHILEFPATGHSCEGGTRKLTVAPFPFGIVFEHVDDEIIILAVAHHARRPGYWIDED